MKPQFEEPLGKVHDVRDGVGRIIFSANDRSVCLVHGKRDKTTVNGVCLPCTKSDKHRPQGGRRGRR